MVRDRRRLAAIVSADVAGYSRLMGLDDSDTLARLKAHRRELIDPKIAEYDGRIVKTTGDGLLLEFPSVVDAVRCAVDVQRGMAERNVGLPADQRIDFRVGINVGDIIIDGEDIFGDGVNVAARVQVLAEPGGICAAKVVRDQVLDKLSFAFEDLGAQLVENIARPVEVYRVALDKGIGTRAEAAAAPTALATTRSWTRRARMLIGISVAAIAVLGAVVAWYFNRHPEQVAASAGAEASPRSIMVVPFRAPADDGQLQSLAQTLASDLSRSLADALRDVHVVAPDTARDIAPADYGRKARYVVDGEIRASGDDAIIITRLVDAVLSKQVGSDRRVVARARVTPEQEQLTLRLTYAMRENFDNAELRRSAAPLPPNATARQLVDRARMLTDTMSGEDLTTQREARKLFDQAIARDPSLVAAWTGRTDVGWNEFINDYKGDRAKLLSEMDRDSARAIDLDPQDPVAWTARNQALQFTSRFEAAFAANDRVHALAPAYGFFLRGFLLIFAGRAEEALALVQARNAMLARTDPGIELVSCDAYLHLGNYRLAIVHCEQDAAVQNAYWNYLNLTAAYAHAGEMTKAAAARDELLRRVPDFNIARFKAKQWSTHPTWVRQNEEHLIAGLRKAGVPE